MHNPEANEAYDILATDPISGDFAKIQVKTIRQRMDRGGDLVVYARKSNGTSYDRSEVDLFVGVWANNGAIPRVFIFENRLLSEYWCSEVRASERWVELDISLNREPMREVNAIGEYES